MCCVCYVILVYRCFCFFPDIVNSDSESFNPALWEEQRKQRSQVAFECDEDKDEREAPPRVSATHIFVTAHVMGKGGGALQL